ncbi:MAG: SDR family oxidoreductase [Deltaproteobacteria bacterium]|nr:SDR family oxidoreductase [Deltaproteobacteria bacterium]
MKTEDLRIIVTGAASGMGRHFAMELVKAGAHVAAGDVNEEGLRSLAEETKGLPGKLVTGKLNVADEANVVSFVENAAEKLGTLNGLINNAGILRDGLLVKKDKETGAIKKLTKEQWQQVIDVNLTGPFLMAREVAAKMVQSGQKGVIVNISSLARMGNRGQSNYSAAKAGLAADTRTWAIELAPFGIRVGAVAPGLVETPIILAMPDKARNALIAGIPVGKIGSPHEIWLAVKFIVECDYFTGRVVDVDGGACL